VSSVCCGLKPSANFGGAALAYKHPDEIRTEHTRLDARLCGCRFRQNFALSALYLVYVRRYSIALAH
jgi:hypothetical protein